MRRSSSEPLSGSTGLESFRRDIERCVKCGSCRAVCPPFLSERGESFSARGRIALVKAVLDGRLAVSAIFKDRLATCTGCLACEAACPNNVPVTEIIQTAKEQAIRETGPGIIQRAVSGVVRHPAAFRAAAWLAPVVLHYTKNRTAWVKGHGTGSVKDHKANAARGRVVFYPGCAVSFFQQDIGRSAVAVLSQLGYDVVIPRGLSCCGRPALSLGDRRTAEELAARNAAILEAADADAVVTACASCSLTFNREYPKLLRPGVALPVVRDIHELLAQELPGTALRQVKQRVTWHDPCHLGRGLGLSNTAREIIRSIPGLTLAEMRDADRCCGFGGVMRITHHRLSDRIVEDKARNIIATQATVVITGCPGCRMQIQSALDRAGANVSVKHTVQVLEKAITSVDSKR